MPDKLELESTNQVEPEQKSLEFEKPEKPILGFKPNVFFLGIVSLLNDAASEIIYPLVPKFLKTVFDTQFGIFLGIIEGIAEGTASLMKLASGWYSDKVKKNKAFVIVGYGISIFLRPLLGLAHFINSWLYVLGIRFSDRVGKGIRTAPRDALIANSINADERGKSFGFHRAMDHFGAVIGGLIAFGLIMLFRIKEPSSLWWIFLFAFVPGIISLYFIIAKIKDISPASSKSNVSKTEKLTTTANFNSHFKIYLLVLALFTLGNSSDMFLLARISDIEDFWYKVPLVWAVFHTIKSALSTPAGILSDKIGRKGMIVPGWLIYSAVYFGFAFTQSAQAAWILFMLYAVYYAMTEGVAKALVSDLTPKEAQGTAFGWFHFVEGITLIPASIVFGALYDKSPKFAFSFGASLALAASVLLIIFVPGKIKAAAAEISEIKLEGTQKL